MEQPNLNYLKKLSEGDKFMEKKIISIIKKEFPLEKEEFYKQIKDKNFVSAQQNVHKIKHKIAFLGLEKGYEITAQFEDNLKNNSIELMSEFEAIIESINQFIKTLEI